MREQIRLITVFLVSNLAVKKKKRMPNAPENADINPTAKAGDGQKENLVRRNPKSVNKG